jgi:phosphoglycerate dehydrogenase-like enzyme
MAKNYLTHIENQKKHFWPNDFKPPYENVDIAGKILGIMGAGAIGSEVAHRAKALQMTVYGYDPYLTNQKNFDKIYNDPAEISKFLGESDFVVTSLPANEETRNIINAASFASMKPTAFFLNVARGELIDEDALVDALNRGIIRGAAIDVAREEPLPAESPLWTAKNILITPHRAAYGDVMRERMCRLIEANVCRYMNQEPLLDQVVL